MHALDESFRNRKRAVAETRRRAARRRLAIGFGVAALLAAAALYASSGYWLRSVYDEELEFAEDAHDIGAEAPVWVPVIVDLAGDPMWISLSHDDEGETRLRVLDRPAELAEAGIPAGVSLLSDAMVSTGERFMTTIPATQEDFAFFQAQRASAALPASFDPATPFDAGVDPGDGEAPSFADEAAGWGETIGEGEAALPDFTPTEIENNTSVAMARPQPERYETTQDFFVRVLVERGLASVVLENAFSDEDAARAAEAMQAAFGRDTLEPGFVVAMRGHRAGRGAALSLMQVSVYASDVYVGSLARNAAGAFVSSVDPWVRDDLFNYSGEPRQSVPGQQYRLLDAIYSTAARNSVPTGVIGEAIMYLSRGQDLNAFATPDDRLVLLYTDEARGDGAAGGRVLYVGVHGPERTLECYVFRQDDGDHSCVSGDDLVHSLTIANGMVTPVNGVLTSAFGPRRHPILKTVRIHKGVDWAAPAGTPIFAAFAGEIVFQGDGGGYGNLVRIAHVDGSESRYAHMQRFEASRGLGAAVAAGDVIGYVGTTGMSTGPHLHFELHRGGEAIDPLATMVAAATSDGSAVETLVDSIIRVESAGNPRARNPLSTATGLGQFIESTWVRMMNTYRPDLAASLSRADLLALRFDPTISREMVRNLAREGEAYLRARGHQITAGRLYLCHFLGMDGAHQVLSSSGERTLIDVLGAGVIRANPFLTGKDVSYIVNWAEVKMRGRGRASSSAPPPVATAQVRQTSPEFERYKAAVAQLLEAAAM